MGRPKDGPVKIRLLTAQRGDEGLSMRWEQISGDWWTIPADVVKNDLAHRVPILPQIQALPAEMRGLTGGGEPHDVDGDLAAGGLEDPQPCGERGHGRVRPAQLRGRRGSCGVINWKRS